MTIRLGTQAWSEGYTSLVTEEAQWSSRSSFVSHTRPMKVLSFFWPPILGYGSLSADPVKHGSVWRVRCECRYFSFKMICEHLP